MSEIKKRNEQLVPLGFENVSGAITLVKSYKDGIAITSVSINLQNVFAQDIDWLITELQKQKEVLAAELKSTFSQLID